jgi:hypothetical protein
MDIRAISAVLLKVAGLVLIALSIAQVPSHFPLAMREGWGSVALLLAIAVGIGPQLLLGAAFWFFPGTIANKIVAGPTMPEASDFKELQLVALAVVGVYLIAQALTECAYLAATVIAVSRESPDVPLTPLAGRAAAAIAELMIGVGICLGRAGISALIHRMRGR